MERQIFHESCMNCTSQLVYGIEKCKYCCYYQADWALKDLSTTEQPKIILPTLEEKMQQEAEAFANYLHLNYQPDADTGNWIDHHKQGNEGIIEIKTTSELYNEYQKQKA